MGKLTLKIMACALALAGCAVDGGVPGSEDPVLSGKADGFEFGSVEELMTDGNTSEPAFQRTLNIQVESASTMLDTGPGFARLAFRDWSESRLFVAEVAPAVELVETANEVTEMWDAWRADTPVQIVVMDHDNEADPFAEGSDAIAELQRFLDASPGTTIEFEVTQRVTRDTFVDVDAGNRTVGCHAQFSEAFDVRMVSGLPDLPELSYSIQPAFSDDDIRIGALRRMVVGSFRVDGAVTPDLAIVPATPELAEELISECGAIFYSVANTGYAY